MTRSLARLAVAALFASLILYLPAESSAQNTPPEVVPDTATEAPKEVEGEIQPEDAAPGDPTELGNRYDVAVLQGLDKITARISTFEAPVDGIAHFGSLKITARTCHKRPPEEPPESTVFLEIIDVRPDAEAVEVFSGWMFASSPALSAMEHPVYDVWVIDCKNVESSDPVSSEEN